MQSTIRTASLSHWPMPAVVLAAVFVLLVGAPRAEAVATITSASFDPPTLTTNFAPGPGNCVGPRIAISTSSALNGAGSLSNEKNYWYGDCNSPNVHGFSSISPPGTYYVQMYNNGYSNVVSFVVPAATPPTLSSATYDPATRTLAAQWSQLSWMCSNYFLIGTSPSTDSEGAIQNAGGFSLSCSETSVSGRAIGGTAGTRYAQVRSTNPNDQGRLYSNVLSFTIPQTSADTGTSPSTETDTDTGTTPPDACSASVLARSWASPPRANASACAAGPSAEVTVERGEATVNGQPVTGPIRLAPGATIVTGRDTLVALQLDGGSKLHLGSNSTFILGYDTSESILEKFKGKIRVLTQRRFKVRAISSTSSVRGTTFTVETIGSSTVQRTYAGSVAFANTKGKRKRTVLVKKGFQSVVRGSKPPTKPKKFKAPKKPFWK